jgi:putative solute:sodium symporter small subunit
MADSNARSYWKANIRIVASLLAVWFFVSFVCGILLVDFLDNFRFAGFKLGFWMAQQGSIYVFVVLIFVYIKLMDRLDAKYNLDEAAKNSIPSQNKNNGDVQ